MSRLEQCRKNKELTQQELADLSGVSQALISAYERGERKPTNKTLVRLARTMGVRVRDLLPAVSGGEAA